MTKRFTYVKNNSITQYQALPIQEIGKGKALNCQGIVDKLNKLSDENEKLRLQLNSCSDQRNEFYRGARENANRVGKLLNENDELKNENERLVKMLDNVANYMQREYREMPLDDFVEWWNNMAIEGLEDDDSVNENKIRKRKVKADGRVDYVGILKEDLE